MSEHSSPKLDQELNHDGSFDPDTNPKGSVSSRGPDPNVQQFKASTPDQSVWVNASAGTGKTKVLTDRVLRLLLPQSKSGALINGTAPHRILCLTFTKAAASEMSIRIHGILGKWAVMPEKELHKQLAELLGHDPEPLHIEAARTLFAEVIDSAGGLQIMTIHSFCQSVLGRFPLEAGLKPYFTALEERQAAQLLKQAQKTVLHQARSNKGSPLNEALQNVSAQLNHDHFDAMIQNIASERAQFEKIHQAHFDMEGLYTALCAYLEVDPVKDAQAMTRDACDDRNFAKDDLLLAARTMIESGSKTDVKNGQVISNWLTKSPQERALGFQEYASCYLTDKEKIRKDLAYNDSKKALENIDEILRKEAQRIEILIDDKKRLACAKNTYALFVLAKEILDCYDALKREKNALDFDDLILKTKALLTGALHGRTGSMMAPWVLFKLDQGLDHILIDEAQDTNPEQWEIIDALCTEFYDGVGAHDDIERTVFVVGDEKQSIYSFQRASPEEFTRMRDEISRRIERADKRWEPVAMNISFRSVQAVLDSVDLVFSCPEHAQGLGLEPIKHISYRHRQGGQVTLWPKFESQKTESTDFWTQSHEISSSASGSALCAEFIAGQIQNWLSTGEKLVSQGRPIDAGDIMVLVRKRSAFVAQLMRALKLRNIPVAGADRMILGEQLAVEDIMAALSFVLWPDDDLTLACLLKSPLIGLSEEQLFDLCYERVGSLWDALRASSDQSYKPVVNYLRELLALGQQHSPYEVMTHLLSHPCPADPLSGLRAMKRRLGEDCLDPLQELQNTALAYEASHIPTMQGFVQSLKAEKNEIKREMEEGAGQVRIMTVHASKGLEAPIVILPDTLRSMKKSNTQVAENLLWPQKTGLKLPLWSPRKAMNFEAYSEAAKHIEAAQDAEYRRLLYVAMTRAEDRLYITGFGGKADSKRKPLEDSWYNMIAKVFEQNNQISPDKDGHLTLRYEQMKEVEVKKDQQSNADADYTPPEWLYRAAPQEPSPPRPLMPSRPSMPEPEAVSPLEGNVAQRFKRGNLTHKLLQILPDLPDEKRISAAERYLAHFGSEFSRDVQSSIISEVMALLQDDTFAPIFGPGSMAEVPLSGLIHNKTLVSGQVDRLLIKDDTIWIIDYKTNRPPPQKVDDVPQIYQAQMQSYADLLAQIYPAHTIHAALLWTYGPSLMPLPLK